MLNTAHHLVPGRLMSDQARWRVVTGGERDPSADFR
jgi:hypothetical protein